MSQQRTTTIRRLDRHVEQAFMVALSQLGIHFKEHDEFAFSVITGNKGEGVVTIETPDAAGRVFLLLSNEVLFGIPQVEVTKMNGRELAEPELVHFSHFGGTEWHLLGFLNQSVLHRNARIYDLVGVYENRETAASLLHFLWKYPLVEVDGEDLKMTYWPGALQIGEITLWYSRQHGFVRALINGKHKFVCNWLTYEWSRVESFD